MNKFLMAGILGGVIFFLLGWLVYGVLLMDFMSANSGMAASMQKKTPDMLPLVVSNLAWGFLFALILGKWSTGVSVAQGALRGAVIGLLVALTVDLTMYATTTVLTVRCLAVDITAMTVIAAIGGAGIAWLLGMGKKG